MPITQVALGVSAIASIGGAIASSRAAIAEAESQAAFNKYQADVANQNAILAERTAAQNISIVQMQGAEETKQLQRKYAVLRGKQKVALAASGVGGESVTAGDIATDVFRNQKLDEMAIRYNADIRSYNIREGAKLQAFGERAKASMYGLAAESALRAGKTRARLSILEGAKSVAGIGATYGAYKAAGYFKR